LAKNSLFYKKAKKEQKKVLEMETYSIKIEKAYNWHNFKLKLANFEIFEQNDSKYRIFI